MKLPGVPRVSRRTKKHTAGKRILNAGRKNYAAIYEETRGCVARISFSYGMFAI